MRRSKLPVLFIISIWLTVRAAGQIDSLVQFDPYSLKTTNILVFYNTSSATVTTNSSVGNMENKMILDLVLPDTIQNRFSHNMLASDDFNMVSYPIRTTVAIHPYKLYGSRDRYRASGSGILVSPNAVLTAGHIVGSEAEHIDRGIYFKWDDSLSVTPAMQDGHIQPEIGNSRVKKCYVFKRFVNALGHLPLDDIGLMILDQPIGYETGWMGIGYAAADSFLLKNIFYNFSYPGTDGYDGTNMYYKYGEFSNVSPDMTSANNSITGIPGESGSGFFQTDNTDYTVYGIRTYTGFYTLLTKSKFLILKNLIEENLPDTTHIIPENSIVVYPNPAQNQITIEIPEQLKFDEIIVEMYDLTMQRVFKRTLYDNTLDISDLTSGMYILKFTDDKNYILSTQKLIIK